MAVWVKICANTNVEDALAAAELGADAVGFVFAPSARQVTAVQVREISAELPDGLERVGVFGAVPAEEIAAAAEKARLTTVQLHGGYDRVVTERLIQLLGEQVELIQTVHWTLGNATAAEDVKDQLSRIQQGPSPHRVLIDTKIDAVSGGTGVSFDWASAEPVLNSQPTLRVIVAGGLRPDNVALAIGTFAPWGVDVASGVERMPGRKDVEKLKAFIGNARRA